MPSRDSLTNKVIRREWLLFQAVDNIGGTASCQTMPKTFEAMRRAQFSIWSTAAIESWDDDLASYERRGINPFTLKYAYMMSSTHPDEFARMKNLIPLPSERQKELVERLVAIQLAWAEDLAARYPSYMARGRALRSSDDTAEITSMETYARGEYNTYSEHTLQELLHVFQTASEQGENLQEKCAIAQVASYGYRSLDDIEQAIREQRMGTRGLDDAERTR